MKDSSIKSGIVNVVELTQETEWTKHISSDHRQTKWRLQGQAGLQQRRRKLVLEHGGTGPTPVKAAPSPASNQQKPKRTIGGKRRKKKN